MVYGKLFKRRLVKKHFNLLKELPTEADINLHLEIDEITNICR